MGDMFPVPEVKGKIWLCEVFSASLSFVEVCRYMHGKIN